MMTLQNNASYLTLLIDKFSLLLFSVVNEKLFGNKAPSYINYPSEMVPELAKELLIFGVALMLF